MSEKKYSATVEPHVHPDRRIDYLARFYLGDNFVAAQEFSNADEAMTRCLAWVGRAERVGLPFPKFMIADSRPKMVVLFSKPKHGTVIQIVSDLRYPDPVVGFYSDDWCMSHFRDAKESILIGNPTPGETK